MPTIDESLNRAKYLLGLVIGLIAYATQFFGIEQLTKLPSEEAGYAKILIIGVIVVFTLIIILLSKYVAKANLLWMAVILAIVSIGSVALALKYKNSEGRLVTQVHCTDEQLQSILRPQLPSLRLTALIEPYVDLETAWCDSPDRPLVRRLAQAEDANESNTLIVSLILAQSLIVLVILLLLWKINLSYNIGTPPAGNASGNSKEADNGGSGLPNSDVPGRTIGNSGGTTNSGDIA